MNTAAQLLAPQLLKDISDQEFNLLKRIAHDWAGINLEMQQRAMLYSRFCKRLKQLGFSDFGQYADYARSNETTEREYFVNKVTTNLTYFFRESHHFEHLLDKAIPSLQSEVAARGKVRIWSAACSSGQEPYSIAIALASKQLHKLADLCILCTDINTEMIRRARSGTFHSNELRGLSEAQKSQWFKQTDAGLEAVSELRELILCNTLNLFGPWPFSGPVDIIFCRNALIYFSREMQSQLVERFASVQRPGAFLYLGHSETVQGIQKLYERIENTVYRRLP